MKTKTIENVEFYRDFNCKDKFQKPYNIEVVNDKVRVINTFASVFGGKPKSRLNKVSHLGGTLNTGDKPNVYLYGLAVEGKRVYFKLNYNILSL